MYNIFYRSNKVFCKNNEWFFEDDEGEPFGPFDSKDKTLKAIRIYQDVKSNGVQLNVDKIRKIM
ncbi:DUF6316 family protein [Pleionea sp. CnH1-48]|uniref:DUF6316 family protein n=1 Tax=Pleionea sp. CnH1-48 TaxID=2954494 RepID=UPI002096CD24|nr:DUF6316 family protein [Pleionea sp. CnH1-48]